MGDRCYLTLTIHGHIETVRALVEIAKAIVHEGLTDYDDMGGRDMRDVVQVFADELDSGHAYFVNQECNYADISTAEDMLQKHKVAYSIDHSSGGDYNAGCKAFTPEKGVIEFSSDGDEAVLTVPAIRHALADGKLEQLLADADLATGRGLPKFTVSEKVRRVLAKMIAKEAIGIAA